MPADGVQAAAHGGTSARSPGSTDKTLHQFSWLKKMYCGPVLRHPAEFMLPAVDLGGRVWLGGKPCKGGPAAPAFGG
jgi:hypothetical protein